MAHYGYDDGWTLVQRRRRRGNYDSTRPAQYFSRNFNQHAQNRQAASYADVVKFGRRPAFHQFPQHQNVPQQAPLIHRENPPYFYRPKQVQRAAPMRRPRNPVQNRSRVTFVHPQNHIVQQNKTANPQRSEDPLFVPKTRAMLKIIKLVHHKNNIGQGLPPAIQKMEQHLSQVIKPALPNTDTQALIDGNAKNWAYTTLLILKDHYEDTLKSELANFENFSSQGWEDCFNTATQWAKRAMGRRLRDITIHEARTLVQQHWQTTTNQPIII